MPMKFEKERYPQLPGVYMMYDAEDHIIYVGKAKSLRERLGQYFGKNDSLKTNMLVGQIEKIEFLIVGDEKEALILESNLIKTHQPKYNMVLKDARHYSYLAITDEKFPRLLVVRKNSAGIFRTKAKKYYGPFVEEQKRSISARYLRKLFKIRICNKLPKKECLQYHLGNCDAPCINKTTQEEYKKNIDALEDVLGGKNVAKGLEERLGGEMKEASEKLEFEEATKIRDKMQSLDIFFQKQNVENSKNRNEDYLWFSRIDKVLYIQMLKSRNGVIGRTERRRIDINEQEDPEISFILQYYVEFPESIYTNLTSEQTEQLNRTIKGSIIKTAHGERLKILEIAKNSLEYGENEPSVMKLKEELGLKSAPVVIETFDISTLFGTNTVASMVQFVNGKPRKNEYRKFIIKEVVGQDDFASINEVVKRRYSRIKREGGKFPDLVVIDGGVGQLHAAMNALRELGITLSICSLAKEEEEIYLPGRTRPIRLERTNIALKLIQQTRDEAHRFGVSFQRKRHEKSTFKSEG
ncbi:excinuclease ABC subunit UvrC [Candidatus Micrarchaeota archaeon]|nr:excinuclease ABC subunit UvrC [Candidatus Micrarchaeota archaeon]